MNPSSSTNTLWCKASLQYPVVNQLGLDAVVEMLNKAVGLSVTAPFQWTHIDRPADGSIFLVYMPGGGRPAPDGFMYMDNEQDYHVNVAGSVIQILEHKYGFIPGEEHITSRSRRRFRFANKNPQDVASSLWLLLYSRTDESNRVPAHIHQAQPQPMRQYPLPPIQGKPFNIYSTRPGGALPAPQSVTALQAQQVALYQQQQQQRLAQGQQQQHPGRSAQARSTMMTAPYKPDAAPAAGAGAANTFTDSHRRSTIPQKRPAPDQAGATVSPYDDPQGDALDFVTPRDLSLARYQLHHEWMEEVLSPYDPLKLKPSAQFTKVAAGTLEPEALKQRIQADEEAMAEMRVKQAERIKPLEGAMTASLLDKLQAVETKEQLAALEEEVRQATGLQYETVLPVQQIKATAQAS